MRGGEGRIGGAREREEIKGKGEMGGRIEKRKEGVKCRNSMEAKSMEKVEEERKQEKQETEAGERMRKRKGSVIQRARRQSSEYLQTL